MSSTMELMQYHDVANLFPMMTDEEYKSLVNDIRVNGLMEPIWIHGGKIIDGRNRYRACLELDIIPSMREWNGDGSLVSFVVSLNLQRRHLTSSQRAVIALEIEKHLAVEARDRQISLAGTRPNTYSLIDLEEIITQGNGHTENTVEEIITEKRNLQSRDEAATMAGTNSNYVSVAKKLEVSAPELLEKVRIGELTIPQAKQELKKQDALDRIAEVEQANDVLPLADKKYRVIYADPPWKYGNTMPDYFDEQAHHYTLMSIKDICNMPVKDMCMDNAVLFLWVTSPILAEAFDVITSWGFTYKSSFVWDKIKHNMGHYNSVRHELLLVCTRGSCQPDVQKLFDSVQSIERTKHSEKPEQFREIIDTIYPNGPRIELFARKETKGWDNYGNEVSR